MSWLSQLVSVLLLLLLSPARGLGSVCRKEAVPPVCPDPSQRRAIDPSAASASSGAVHITGVFVATVSAGDVNHDGLADAVFVAGDDAASPSSPSAALWIVAGRPRDAQWPQGNATTPRALVRGPPEARVSFGTATASGVDVNGDGVDDVLVACPDHGDGHVYVVFGADGSLPSVASVAELDGSNGFDVTGSSSDFSRANRSLRIGASLATGDFNGDGVGDVAVGAPGADVPYASSGMVFVLFGRPRGAAWPAVVDVAEFADGLRGCLVAGLGEGVMTGQGLELGGLGDVNGDGVDDLGVGSDVASHATTAEGDALGCVAVVWGHRGPWDRVVNVRENASVAAMVWGETDSLFGGRVSMSPMDFDGDGFADVATWGFDGVWIVYGHGGPWEANTTVARLAAQGLAGMAMLTTESFVSQIVPIGDWSGDCIDDLALANVYNNITVLLGSRDRVSGPYPGVSDANITCKVGLTFTNCVVDSDNVAPIVASGDFDGDMFEDVVFAQSLDLKSATILWGPRGRIRHAACANSSQCSPDSVCRNSTCVVLPDPCYSYTDGPAFLVPAVNASASAFTALDHLSISVTTPRVFNRSLLTFTLGSCTLHASVELADSDCNDRYTVAERWSSLTACGATQEAALSTPDHSVYTVAFSAHSNQSWVNPVTGDTRFRQLSHPLALRVVFPPTLQFSTSRLEISAPAALGAFAGDIGVAVANSSVAISLPVGFQSPFALVLTEFSGDGTFVESSTFEPNPSAPQTRSTRSAVQVWSLGVVPRAGVCSFDGVALSAVFSVKCLDKTAPGQCASEDSKTVTVSFRLSVADLCGRVAIPGEVYGTLEAYEDAGYRQKATSFYVGQTAYLMAYLVSPAVPLSSSTFLNVTVRGPAVRGGETAVLYAIDVSDGQRPRIQFELSSSLFEVADGGIVDVAVTAFVQMSFNGPIANPNGTTMRLDTTVAVTEKMSMSQGCAAHTHPLSFLF
eukprot:m51a1_g4461 hypothetical protein (971) ;mRNA; f:186287-189199